MGYRSEVVLAIAKELIPFFVLLFPKDGVEKMVLNESDIFDRDYGGEKAWLIAWQDVKWYEDYPDVAAIEKFVTDAESDEYSFTDDDGNEIKSSELIRFVRAGEAPDDIEVRGDGFWDIRPETSIVW